jgi:hypothetical protein
VAYWLGRGDIVEVATLSARSLLGVVIPNPWTQVGRLRFLLLSLITFVDLYFLCSHVMVRNAVHHPRPLVLQTRWVSILEKSVGCPPGSVSGGDPSLLLLICGAVQGCHRLLFGRHHDTLLTSRGHHSTSVNARVVVLLNLLVETVWRNVVA